MFRSLRFSSLGQILTVSTVLFVLFPEQSARAEDAFEWFYGTWRTSYPDSAYIEYINGTAIVSRSDTPGGAPVVTLLLQDTVTKENFRFDIKEISQTDTEIVMKFHGSSPSAAKTYNGRNDPAKVFNKEQETLPEGVSGVLVKNVSSDSLVSISSTSETLPASVAIAVSNESGFPIDEELTLILSKVSPESLSGHWRYADSATGMYGKRGGRRIVSKGYVEGTETWAKLTRNAIAQVAELKDKRVFMSGADVEVPYLQTHLNIEGYGLPVDGGEAREIIFDSPHIKYDETDPNFAGGFVYGRRGETLSADGDPARPDILEVRIKVNPGVAAGPKTFKINGIDAVWVLQFEEAMEDLVFRRQTGEGEAITFEPASVLVQGDIFLLEAKVSSELMFGKRLLSLKNGKREIYRTVIDQSDSDVRTYTSAPMKVTSGGPVILKDGRVPDIFPIAASPGEILTVYTADTEEPIEWGSVDVLKADALEKPKLIVHPPNQWLSDHSISSIVVDEPFGVYLRLPKKDLVKTTEIVFTNLRTEESNEVELRYKGGSEDALVAYLGPESNLTIHSGLEDRFANWMGTPISLIGTQDGDVVEVSFGDDVKTRFSAFDTRLKQRLGVRRQQLAATKQGLLTNQGNPDISPEMRAKIALQIALINHAEQFVAHKSLFDTHRVAVLEAYLGLIQEGFAHFKQPATWAVHPTYGVPMLSSREQTVVGNAINVTAKASLHKSLFKMGEALSIGLNRFVMEQTGVNGAYMAVYGRDVMGRRINMMERVLGALEAFGAIESNILSTWRRKQFAAIEAKSQSGITKARKAKDMPGFPASDDGRVRRMTEILKDLDIENPARSARNLLDSKGDMPSDIAAIAAAYDNGVPASQIMKKLDMAPQELAELIDQYHKDYLGVENAQARRNMLRRYMGDDAPMPFDLIGTESKKGSTILRDRTPTPDSETPTVVPPSISELPEDPRFDPARLRHQGREPMNTYVNRMYDKLDAHDRLFPFVAEEKLVARRARAMAALDRQHAAVDIIEDITGGRQRRDYGSVGVWQAKGCNPRECAIGQVFMNHTNVSPRRVMSVLQMSEEEYRGVLENFLRGAQSIDNPAFRQQIIDEYIAGG
jgi:hypothetical protein